jgi:hypothetical protein
MNGISSNFRIAFQANDRARLAMLVGLAIGLILFGPGALQGLTLLRASQYETNENRSESETSDRIHAAVQPARSLHSKGAPDEKRVHDLCSTDMARLLQRAIAESRLMVPTVVEWSPSMLC